MVESYYWIWYQLLFGFGTARLHTVLEKHPCPKILYEKLCDGQIEDSFLYKKERENWKQCLERAKQLEHITHRKKCAVITPDHQDYPKLLHNIYAKPTALYVKGDLSCLQENLIIAMVGARRNSDYGEEVASYFAANLAYNNSVVVSGLAHGIDSIALESAVKNGGKAIGVLACGLDIDYPKGNARLKRAVCENGAVVTEYPMGTIPKPYRFPPRNRVLAGMSHGVMVIEASEHSGALITATHALDYGRDVFVPPSNIFSGSFLGSHNLIKKGTAKLVTSCRDIMEEYEIYSFREIENANQHISAPDKKAQREKTYNEETKTRETNIEPEKIVLPEGLEVEIQEVYSILSNEKKTANQISDESQLPIEEVMAALTTLEILALAVSYPGGYFTLLQLGGI